MLRPVIISLISLSLAACATTAQNKTAQLKTQEVVNFSGIIDFVDAKDGAKYQGGTGLYCPSTALGLSLANTYIYNEKGTDVSCNYDGESGDLTVYLSEYPGTSLDGYFQTSSAAVSQGNVKDLVSYDEEASKSCIVETQFINGLEQMMLADKKGEGSTINIDPSGETGSMPLKAAVFSGEAAMSYLMISPLEPKFMKLRYTYPKTAANAEKNSTLDCQALNGLMAYLLNSVGKPEGGSATNPMSFLDQLDDKS